MHRTIGLSDRVRWASYISSCCKFPIVYAKYYENWFEVDKVTAIIKGCLFMAHGAYSETIQYLCSRAVWIWWWRHLLSMAGLNIYLLKQTEKYH